MMLDDVIGQYIFMLAKRSDDDDGGGGGGGTKFSLAKAKVNPSSKAIKFFFG